MPYDFACAIPTVGTLGASKDLLVDEQKVASTYAVVRQVHSDILCLVDGATDVLLYLATVTALPRSAAADSRVAERLVRRA